MFYTATAEQIEQLYPELITMYPEKTRFFYQDPKINRKRLVDRVFGYYFSDKPWGLEQEYLTEGINQQWTNEDDLLSLNIRNTIQAPDGWTFVAEDYAAEELRLNAINTGCKAMMKAFVNGLDVHTETARAMFGEEELAKNKKYCRTKAKFFEFGCNGINCYYLTSEGYKLLKDAKDLLDLEGKPQKFRNIVMTKPMYHMYLSNGQVIDVTQDHKMPDMSMINPEYKTVYEGMCIPQIKHNQIVYNNINSTHFVYDFKSEGKFNSRHYEYDIKLTKDLGYLIGYYLADGSINNDCSLYLVSKPSNKDYLVKVLNEYLEIFRTRKDTHLRIYDYLNYSDLKLTCTVLCKFIDTYFGHKDSKHISELAYSNEDFALGILTGILDGDYKINSNNISLCQTRESLHRDVANLCSFLGIPTQEKISKYEYKGITKPMYYLTILDTTRLDFKNEKLANIPKDVNHYRYLKYSIKTNSDKFEGKYNDKLNLLKKGIIKSLTTEAIGKYLPTLPHNKYYPVYITKLVPFEGEANVMECETNKYIANGMVNHNCCYGGSWRVAQQKGEPDEEAQANYEKFKMAWSDMFSVQDQQVRASHQTLSEHSFFGFPVRLHRYYGSKEYRDINAGERLAKNHRIQSTGADILSIAFIRLWNNIFNNPQFLLKLDILEWTKYHNKYNPTFDETKIPEIVQSGFQVPEGYVPQSENYIRFQLTVHDEIDFIIRTELLDIMIPEITKCMTVQMPDWKIPVSTGLSIGPTFGQLYEFKYDTKENGYIVLGPEMEPVKPKEPKKEEPKQEEPQEKIEIAF